MFQVQACVHMFPIAQSGEHGEARTPVQVFPSAGVTGSANLNGPAGDLPDPVTPRVAVDGYNRSTKRQGRHAERPFTRRDANEPL